MSSTQIQPAPGGIQDGLKGIEYQKKLIELFSLNAFNRSLNFNCWTEDARAGKFDDVIFSYESEGRTEYTFVQAKHKDTPKRLDYQSFLGDKNFQLVKYFDSFLDIERNFEINYGDVDLNAVIIATNNNFPKPKYGKVTLVNPASKNLSLRFEITKNHGIFDGLGSTYAFVNSKENLNSLKNLFLAIELVRLLFQNFSNFQLLNHAKDFLVAKVFNLTENSIEFRSEFLQSNSSELESFKQVAIKTLNEIEKNRSDLSSENFWEFLETMPLDLNLVDKIQNFTSDDDLVDQKIYKFMSKYLIVTNLGKNQIENAIKFEILSQINDLEKLEMASLVYSNFVKNWLLNDQKSQWSPISQVKVLEIFDTIPNKLKNEKLLFSNFHPDLSKFISNSVHGQILVYETAAKETFWGAIKVQNLDKSIFYLNSQYDDSIFDLALKTLKESADNRKICLIIECPDDPQSFLSKYWRSFATDMTNKKNAKLILICERRSDLKSVKDCMSVVQNEILCSELTQESINSFLDKKILNFQGTPFKIEKLLKIDQLKNFSLSELKNITEIGKPPMKPDLYIARSMYRKVNLKNQLLEDFNGQKFKDHLCFSEKEYNQLTQSNKRVHRIDKDSKVSHLIWKKSSHSLQPLRDYVEKYDLHNLSDENFLSNFEPICLISGQAGMGKSSFLMNLAHELKEQFPSYWVQKFDLQTYSADLKELETKFSKKKLKRDDSVQIRKFFSEKFVKFESPLVRKIFEEHMKSGKVFLLLDGYDEIVEGYKDTVISIVSALMEVSADNKIFLSTRPEWSDLLEEKFLQFVYWFHPFNEQDQIKFLHSFWGKDDTWNEFTKSILENINKCLTEQQQSYTGIPLITKLVGEFFMDDLKDKDLSNALASDLTSKSYSLVDLMERFLTRHFEICCTTRLGINEHGPIYQSEMEAIEEDHIMLALLIIFPKFFKKCFPNFKTYDEKSKLRFIKTGLVFEVNEVYKFYHQTTPEYLVALFFVKNSNDTQILKFLFEVVLKKLGYQVIRLFLNDIIANLITAENKINFELLAAKHYKILHVAAKEGNLNTFNAVLDVLMESNNLGNCFSDSNAKVKSIIMSKDEDDFSLFYTLFANCDVSAVILEKLKQKFGLEFVREVLLSKNGKLKANLMTSCRNRNYVYLAIWMFKEFGGDRRLLRKILVNKNQVDEGDIGRYHERNLFFMMEHEFRKNRSLFE